MAALVPGFAQMLNRTNVLTDAGHCAAQISSVGGGRVRSSMYGSFLSGDLGGYVYGAEGIWGADNEPAAPIKM